MTGLDTNILARYLTEDDEHQFRLVLDLLNRKGSLFFVSSLVIVELDWILASLYEWSRGEIVEAIARLLTIQNLVFEDEGQIRGALRAMRAGADLSDELIAARSLEGGCRDFATFDKALAKRHSKFAFTPRA